MGAQVVQANPAHPGCAMVMRRRYYPPYAAPEVIRDPVYDACAADVYALGVVFFATVAGRFPFVAPNPEQLLPLILAGAVEWPVDLPPEVLVLLTSMMHRNPGNRPTAAAILAIPWLARFVDEMGAPVPGPPMSAAVRVMHPPPVPGMPVAPVQGIPAAPVQVMQGAAVQVIPAAPVQVIPAAPVQVIPAAPVQVIPAAPVQVIPAAPVQVIPAAPVQVMQGAAVQGMQDAAVRVMPPPNELIEYPIDELIEWVP
jgi:hypothetical protein